MVTGDSGVAGLVPLGRVYAADSGHSAFDENDQVTAVIADRRVRKPVGFARGEYELVVALVRADAVEEDPQRLVGLQILGAAGNWLHAAVVETRSLLPPRRLGELGPLDQVIGVSAGFDETDVPRLPVRAHAGSRVGEQGTVAAGIDLADGDRAVLGQAVRVEQQPPRRVRRVHDNIQHGLRRQAGVAKLEPAAAVLERRSGLRVSPEFRQPGPDGRPLRHGGQEALGQLVLRLDPACHRRVAGCLQPAIRIANQLTVVVVSIGA